MSLELDAWSAVASGPVPQYSHREVMIGSVILMTTIVVIATVTLLILWGRRGR